MTLQQAIEKAIEGGYDCIDKTSYDEHYTVRGEDWVQQSDILLDPLFWQALGKTQGWGNTPMDFYGSRFELRKRTEIEHKQHLLLDHINEGKDIESYFAGLGN